MGIEKGTIRYNKKQIDDAPYDKTKTGIIKGVSNNGYTVLIDGVEYNNVPTIGGGCLVNETVRVVYPQNKMNNMFILKAPNLKDIPSSYVTSVNARDGDVILTSADVGLGSVDNTSDATKNVLSSTKLTTARTISLDGDVSGSVSFDGSSNVAITTIVADDSHNHIISNVDGLQTALDGKLATTANAVSATKLQTPRTITLNGDISGSASFDGSSNITINTTGSTTSIAWEGE